MNAPTDTGADPARAGPVEVRPVPRPAPVPRGPDDAPPEPTNRQEPPRWLLTLLRALSAWNT
jgi:hypothetical protein